MINLFAFTVLQTVCRRDFINHGIVFWMFCLLYFYLRNRIREYNSLIVRVTDFKLYRFICHLSCPDRETYMFLNLSHYLSVSSLLGFVTRPWACSVIIAFGLNLSCTLYKINKTILFIAFMKHQLLNCLYKVQKLNSPNGLLQRGWWEHWMMFNNALVEHRKTTIPAWIIPTLVLRTSKALGWWTDNLDMTSL